MTCERGSEIAQVLLSNVMRKNAVRWQRESIAHGRTGNGYGGVAGRPALVRKGGENRQAEERERQPPATSTRPQHAPTLRPHYRASMPVMPPSIHADEGVTSLDCCDGPSAAIDRDPA